MALSKLATAVVVAAGSGHPLAVVRLSQYLHQCMWTECLMDTSVSPAYLFIELQSSASALDTQFTKIDVAIADTGANADAVAKLSLEVTFLVR